MTFVSAFSIIAFAALLAGCAGGQRGLVLETVGPARAPAAVPDDSYGTLVVYSAHEVNADFNSRDPYRLEYSDYKIFAEDWKLLRRVHNDSGTILQDLATVSLPGGKYRVVALANGFGFVSVPVVIKTRQNTIVHLEGGGAGNSSVSPTDAVRLPDGQIVGSKSSGWSAGVFGFFAEISSIRLVGSQARFNIAGGSSIRIAKLFISRAQSKRQSAKLWLDDVRSAPPVVTACSGGQRGKRRGLSHNCHNLVARL